MQRLMYLTLIGLLTLACVAIAGNTIPVNVSPTAASGQTGYETVDALGDVIRTIPAPIPGPSDALNGTAYAEGMIIQFENLSNYTSRFHKIDPDDGTILETIPFPFNGFVMGGSYDGTGIWVAQWYPTNVIYKIALDGTIISQFTPATGSYSCRSVNVEGNYLWVGANYSSNNTKLYKMDMSGNILEEYNTSSVVGWYMGGEIDTNAPSGSNLFVVDNIGNAVKRLNVSGGTVTVMEQFGCPDPSDIAEGLAFDGEYFWHSAAYASQGVLWQIDDGIASAVYNVTVTLTPYGAPIQIPATGGTFDFNVALANLDTVAATFDAWTDVTLPGGTTFGPLLGPINITMPVGGSIERDRTQAVPGSAPAGTYYYNAYVGIYPSTMWDSDSFAVEKLAAGDGALVSDWDNWGETFSEGLVSVPLEAPVEYSLMGNYPNPFNPSTTIAFSLPEAGMVHLAVYDLNGRLISTLVNGWRAAGTHSLTFDATGLSSGVYFYKLSSGNFSALHKMVLMK